MFILKIVPVFVLVLAATAEKKIELEDIEADNLKSEKESELPKVGGIQSPNTAPQQDPLDFLKNGLLQYFESHQLPQQPRYVQQYAVTEQPERSHPNPPSAPAASHKSHHHGGAQQGMVGYLSNMPMKIYLVPQYEHEQAANQHSSVHYTGPSGGSGVAYTTAPAYVQPQQFVHAQSQGNYIEVPAYVSPDGKTYVNPSHLAILAYNQPTLTQAQTTVAPVVAYSLPVVSYPTTLVAPPVLPIGYYPHFTDTNAVDDVQIEGESPKHYTTQIESTYNKNTEPEYPRYYNYRFPGREDQRHNVISELPPPNPLVLKNSPPHLSHLPKALPMYRPPTKPVYASGNLFAHSPRPSEAYGSPYKGRPTSLLESYVPSNLQVEYLKKGYLKDPQSAYEALSSGRHFPGPQLPVPRHYERGFLPNQMYHTAAGGITYGHHKRTTKPDRVPRK